MKKLPFELYIYPVVPNEIPALVTLWKHGEFEFHLENVPPLIPEETEEEREERAKKQLEINMINDLNGPAYKFFIKWI